eukprot:Rhum_TRINITY_DN13341_c0_g2::Rhum_TRINITY_DN13341_c0_g2_i1::g.58847::m.58847
MLITASWGGAEVALEVDAECRSVAALKRRLQEALPTLDVEAVRLEVGGRSVYDDEDVLGLSEGSVISISATTAALAAAALREEGHDVSFKEFCRAAEAGDERLCVRLCRLYLEAGVVWPPGVDNPLHIAVRRSSRELCELLLESGCAKDSTNRRGETPLHWAVKFPRTDEYLCKLLLDSGCAKNVHSTDGNTPLHYAVRAGNTGCCKVLLNSGCAKNVQNNKGDTPLHWAIGWGYTELPMFLLAEGCAMDVLNKKGQSPLQTCTEGTEVHALLVTRGYL